MEKKPNKKEQLNIVNNVLKLATKLMKVRTEFSFTVAKLCFVPLFEQKLLPRLKFIPVTLCTFYCFSTKNFNVFSQDFSVIEKCADEMVNWMDKDLLCSVFHIKKICSAFVFSPL